MSGAIRLFHSESDISGATGAGDVLLPSRSYPTCQAGGPAAVSVQLWGAPLVGLRLFGFAGDPRGESRRQNVRLDLGDLVAILVDEVGPGVDDRLRVGLTGRHDVDLVVGDDQDRLLVLRAGQYPDVVGGDRRHISALFESVSAC